MCVSCCPPYKVRSGTTSTLNENFKTWIRGSWCHRAGRRRRSCWTWGWRRASWGAPACWRWSPPCTPGSSPPRSTENILRVCAHEEMEKLTGVNSRIHQAREQKRDISVRSVSQDFRKLHHGQSPVFFTSARLKPNISHYFVLFSVCFSLH